MLGWTNTGFQYPRCQRREKIGLQSPTWCNRIIGFLFSHLSHQRKPRKELLTSGSTCWKMNVSVKERIIIRDFEFCLDDEQVHNLWISAGDPGVVPGSCPNRRESKPLRSRSSSLFLQNYFPTYPVEAEACKEHSAPLFNMISTCYKASGNILPNFLAVNFYMV